MGIKNILSWFKAKKRNDSWFAVSIATHGVYLAHVERRGVMPRLVRCEYHATGAATAAQLEKICRDAGAARHQVTTLLEPGEYQMLLVDAPNVPANEMKNAIRWKIKDGLDCHIDDATVDVLSIPSGRGGSEHALSVYAVVATNATIQRRIALFGRAKIELRVIDIPEMAQRNIAALFERNDRALAMLVFGDEGGMLTFSAGGELYMARHLEINAGQLQDANENLRQQYLDRVELELQRSMDYYDRQFHHVPVSHMLVCAPRVEGLMSMLAAGVDVPVERLDLSQVMDVGAVPNINDDQFLAHALHTLGAALRRESRTL